jgi:hypothetical protein
VNDGGGRLAVLERRVPTAGITPRLAEILAMMVEAALDAEDAGSAVRGKVTVATPTGAPSRPVPIEDLRRETGEESR